jgi:hypothetical protein
MNDREQDITSHVNFTALIRRGQELGLQLTGFVPQLHFLLGLGILEEMESIGKEMSPLEALKLRLSIKHLIEPEVGMGESFKVLVLHKGLHQPCLVIAGSRDDPCRIEYPHGERHTAHRGRKDQLTSIKVWNLRQPEGW